MPLIISKVKKCHLWKMLAVGNSPWRSQEQTLSLPYCKILHIQPSYRVQRASLSKPRMEKDGNGPV